MQSDNRQPGRPALAIVSLGLAAAACSQPAAPPAASPASSAASPSPPLPQSAAEAFSRYQSEYEFGWLTPTGAISYSRVTGVTVEADGNVRVELAEPSLIWGISGPRTLTGQWKDAGGEGELWLQFVADFSSAAGWYNNGKATPQRDVWVRQAR